MQKSPRMRPTSAFNGYAIAQAAVNLGPSETGIVNIYYSAVIYFRDDAARFSYTGDSRAIAQLRLASRRAGMRQSGIDRLHAQI